MNVQPPPLRPREHGAYAMLTFPVVSGLVLGGGSVAGVAFAVLAVSGFLAHESTLVLLGRRGERIRSAAEAAARRRLLALGAVALASCAAFVVTAPVEALAWAVPPAVLGTVVAGLLVAGRGTKSLSAELLVALAFASLHATVSTAGGAQGVRAVLAPVAVWGVSFALATLSVHGIKARFRGRGRAWLAAAAPVGAALVLVVAAAAVLTGWEVAGVGLALPLGALLPKALLVLAVAAVDVQPRQLKTVGWSLVTADTLTLLVLAVGVAAGQTAP